MPLRGYRVDSRFVQSITESLQDFETVDSAVFPHDSLKQDNPFNARFAALLRVHRQGLDDRSRGEHSVAHNVGPHSVADPTPSAATHPATFSWAYARSNAGTDAGPGTGTDTSARAWTGGSLGIRRRFHVADRQRLILSNIDRHPDTGHGF